MKYAGGKTLVVGFALLAAFAAPCLCALPAPAERDAHACCPGDALELRAAEPGCCSCVAAGSDRQAYDRSSTPSPHRVAARSFESPVPDVVLPTSPAGRTFRAAFSPSPPPTHLRL
jgi:hypothetical protein